MCPCSGTLLGESLHTCLCTFPSQSRPTPRRWDASSTNTAGIVTVTLGLTRTLSVEEESMLSHDDFSPQLLAVDNSLSSVKKTCRHQCYELAPTTTASMLSTAANRAVSHAESQHTTSATVNYCPVSALMECSAGGVQAPPLCPGSMYVISTSHSGRLLRLAPPATSPLYQ